MTSPPQKTDSSQSCQDKEQDGRQGSSKALAEQVAPTAAAGTQALNKADIPDLVALERLCFSVPWTAKQYGTVLGNKPFHVFGLRQGAELVGYLTLFAAAREMEILNIAVHPSYRRQGHARCLLSHVLHLCRKMGIKHGFLEVRRSNAPAQSLYKAYGFEEVGVRKRYYPDNQEDAIIMRLDLEAASSPPK